MIKQQVRNRQIKLDYEKVQITTIYSRNCGQNMTYLIDGGKFCDSLLRLEIVKVKATCAKSLAPDLRAGARKRIIVA